MLIGIFNIGLFGTCGSFAMFAMVVSRLFSYEGLTYGGTIAMRGNGEFVTCGEFYFRGNVSGTFRFFLSSGEGIYGI